MARLAPKTDVIRALFAKSGNQCAFPGCTQELISDKQKFIAQICHIEAAEKGGERYNSEQDDEYRRSFQNLIILCYPHHVETDDVEEYPAERLLKMKRDHEQLFLKSDFKIDETALYKISTEMKKYWMDIERKNKVEHIFAGSHLVMEVKYVSDFNKLFFDIQESINGLKSCLKYLYDSDGLLKEDFKELTSRKGVDPHLFDDIPYYKNPFEDRNWEIHNLGLPNCMQRLEIDLTQLKLRFLEEYLKTNSKDVEAREVFECTKKALIEYAQTVTYFD